MKIGNKIGLSFFAVAAIITSITMLILYTKAESNIKDMVSKHLKTTIQSRKQHIETLLQGYRETVEILAAGVVFKEFLSIGRDVPGYDKRLKRVNMRLSEVIKVFEKTFAASLLDKQGIIVASTNEALIGIDKSDDEVFLKAKQAPHIKDLYTYKKTPRLFAMSIAARAFSNDEFLGVVVLDYSTENLFEITFDRTGLGETGEVYLVNKDGYRITPSYFLKDSVLDLKVDASRMQKGFKGRQGLDYGQHLPELAVYTDYRGVRVWGLYGYIPKMGWHLLAGIDEKEALAPLAEVKLVFFALLLGIPVISWVASLFISKVICGPVYKLEKGTEIIGGGNLDHKVGTSAKDEIGQLSRAFDAMTENLKKTTSELNNEISERKQAEEELSKLKDNLEIEVRKKNKALIDAQDKLIHSERLAAMGQLAGTIGHEFRNQLGVIRNAAYFLKMKMADGDEKTTKHFSMLEEEIVAADEIIENILTFARTKKPKFKSVCLKSTLLESINKVNIPEKIKVTTAIDEDLPEIHADQIQLTRIFVNIILNAVQAMEAGGKLTVKAARAGEFVNILFRDTGCGIKQEDKERIFEPFFSAKPRGTGLGLAIAKMFAQGHGGGVNVESEVGKGTTITVRLLIN